MNGFIIFFTWGLSNYNRAFQCLIDKEPSFLNNIFTDFECRFPFSFWDLNKLACLRFSILRFSFQITPLIFSCLQQKIVPCWCAFWNINPLMFWLFRYNFSSQFRTFSVLNPTQLMIGLLKQNTDLSFLKPIILHPYFVVWLFLNTDHLSFWVLTKINWLICLLHLLFA